jgi:hypothetical protein
MNHTHKPETATASFLDGSFTVRLTFPAQDAASWRAATPSEILAHLGLGDAEPAPAGQHLAEEEGGDDDEDEGNEDVD